VSVDPAPWSRATEGSWPGSISRSASTRDRIGLWGRGRRIVGAVKTPRSLLFCLPLVGLVSSPLRGEIAANAAPTAEIAAVTARSAAAANAFLATLSEPQRTAILFKFDDEEQRRRWSNLPTPMFVRKGLKLGDLTAPQRQAALAMLGVVLSPAGYEKVLAIAEGDEQLKDPAAAGRGVVFGRDEYYLSLLGRPSNTDPWMIQFGGHHLALNITLHGPAGILTPSHTAAQPSTYTLNGKTVRPLGGEYDKAFAFMGSLDAEQKARAVIGARMADLVLGPGHDDQVIVPEGLPGAKLSASQRKLLLDVAHEWVGIIHASAAEAKMAEIASHLDETYFAWSGPTEPGSAAYYRIQGPTVIIEFAPQGGSGISHLHTMYRDPTSDYGRPRTSK